MTVMDAITTDQYAGKGGTYIYNEGTGTRTLVVTPSEGGQTIIKDRNHLLRTNPTRIGIPYARDDSASTTNTIVRDSAVIALDNNKVSPCDGLSTAKITIPASISSYQEFHWDNLTSTFTMGDDDVWIIPFYASRAPGTLGTNVQIMTSSASTVVGSDYRLYTFPASMLLEGWNILTVKHKEVHVSSTTYGIVGTTTSGAWSEPGAITKDSLIRSVRVRIRNTTPDTSAYDCWVGGLYRATSGWCKAAVVLGADDVPRSILDHIIPLVESYGWRMTLNPVSQYAADPIGTYISMDEIRELNQRGHEVWGHTRRHEDMTTVTDTEKDRALRASRDFWMARGMPDPARYIVWPFGKYDNTAITKAKAEGYRLGRAGGDGVMNSWVPALNPFAIRSFSAEISNSWQIDSKINGACLAGRALWLHMHNAIPGGASSNVYPGATSFYVDHYKRWLDLLKSHELAGRVVVATGLEYFDLCGVNPSSDKFVE